MMRSGQRKAAESYQDWEGRIADELKAYTIEIEKAKRLGLDNIAEQLQKNFETEKQYILDRYGGLSRFLCKLNQPIYEKVSSP